MQSQEMSSWSPGSTLLELLEFLMVKKHDKNFEIEQGAIWNSWSEQETN